MSDYEKLNKLSELVYSEIENETRKGSLTPETVRTIGYAVDILKDIVCMKKDEFEMDGYSGHYPERGWQVRPFYSYGDMPDRSYARGRDSMGRYSREYSYDEKLDHLERMMDMAKDPEEREMYRKLLAKAEKER